MRSVKLNSNHRLVLIIPSIFKVRDQIYSKAYRMILSSITVFLNGASWNYG